MIVFAGLADSSVVLRDLPADISGEWSKTGRMTIICYAFVPPIVSYFFPCSESKFVSIAFCHMHMLLP